MKFFIQIFCFFVKSAYSQYDDYSSSDIDNGQNDVLQTEVSRNLTYEIYIGNSLFILENLQSYNVSIDITLPETKSLKHLFIICTAFIDAVWKPFESIEDFLFELLTLQESDQLAYVSDNWKQLADFEIGYLICLIVGILFIVLMPITGIFFCSCRLCNNCGGRLYQDLKDAQSGWRIFHCLALMITNTMILIGMVFVYLTNDWVGQVVKEVGPATLENIDHIYGYTENINSQLAEVYDSYILVENATESELNNVGNLLGEPIANELKKAFNPAFKELEEFQNQLNAILTTLETTDKTLGKLKTDTTNFQGDLETIRDSLKSDLAFPNCGLNTACRSMQINTEFLDISGDYSSLDDMQTEIDNLSYSLTEYNMTEIIEQAEIEIDSIPLKIYEYSNESILALTGPGGTFELIRNQIRAVVDDINSKIDLNQSVELGSFRNEVQGFSDSIDDFEHYRRIVGIVIASIVAAVVVANTLGLCLGFCGYKRQATPTNRSGASNIGGMFLMVGVAISFFFSWILMIIVILTFTVGGHGEKYFCQTLQENDAGNFTGLEFVQKALKIPSEVVIQGYPLQIDLSSIVLECKNNTGLFELLELDEVFDLEDLLNFTVYQQEFQDEFDKIGTVLYDQMTKFISPEQLARLESIKDGDWRKIDYAVYIEEVRKGITTIQLTDFANILNDTANDIIASPMPLTPEEKDDIVSKLQKYSYETVLLNDNNMVALEDTLDHLEVWLEYLVENASRIDGQVDILMEELTELNSTFILSVPDKLSEAAEEYGNNVTRHIAVFSDWLTVQLRENIGACQPIYGIYTNSLNIVCSYMVDSLNAFWFSLGWATVFLIPSIIFSTKLYKWFRRMDQEEYFDEFMTGYDQQNHYFNDASKPSAPPINYLK